MLDRWCWDLKAVSVTTGRKACYVSCGGCRILESLLSWTGIIHVGRIDGTESTCPHPIRG